MSRLTVTLGVAAVGTGAAIVLRPGLAAGTAGPSLVVLFVGAIALVEGVRAALQRLRGRRSRAALPEIERPRRYPTPGDEVDAGLRRLSARPSLERDRRLADLRRRVREAAIARLVAEGHSEATARAALAAGTWTDDPQAAALLADAVEVPLNRRLRAAFRREPAHRLRLRRAIDELAARSGGTRDG